MKLHGGPYNGRTMPVTGKVVYRYGIASRWSGSRPAPGARCGLAVYEPDAFHRNAYWLENQWTGTVVKTVEI